MEIIATTDRQVWDSAINTPTLAIDLAKEVKGCRSKKREYSGPALGP
jgi:hypothetical protein